MINFTGQSLKRIKPAHLLAAAVAILAVVDFALTRRVLKTSAGLPAREQAMENSNNAIEELRTMAELKSLDIKKYRDALQNMAKSKKAIYDAGLSLQEEKRLLEKQLEIMTTYLEVDENTGKIRLMRGDHALKDYPFAYVPLKALGKEAKGMPPSLRVVSKERFSQPERGKVEETGGSLTWNPPQVGKDVRSNALGEYVIFTDSRLILHAPPKKNEEHELFPHLCAGITYYSAKKLYERTFIGTKILYKPAVLKTEVKTEAKPSPKPAGGPPAGKKNSSRKAAKKNA